jgi:hypothetical protein
MHPVPVLPAVGQSIGRCLPSDIGPQRRDESMSQLGFVGDDKGGETLYDGLIL